MRMGSGANGKARGRHVELCKLPSKKHPTRLEAACGAAPLLLITPNPSLPIQFNTSATFGKAFSSQTQPKISGRKLIHSLFLLPEGLPPTVKIHATEKHCNHTHTPRNGRRTFGGTIHLKFETRGRNCTWLIKNPGCSGERDVKTVRRFNHRNVLEIQ